MRRTLNPDGWIDDTRRTMRDVEMFYRPWVERMTDLAPAGYPQAGDTESTISTRAIVDPTGSNVIARQRWDDEWQEMHAILAELLGGARRARNLMVRRLGAVDVDAIRVARKCDGSKLPGWKVPRPPFGDGWAEHQCGRVARTGRGLCEACDQRYRRWESRMRKGVA